MDSYPLDEHDLCSICRESLVNFDCFYSFGRYDDVLRKLIHIFKYSKVETLAGPLSGFLVQVLPIDARFDAVVPMPMHWRKRRQRGFNQAELLARPIARRYGLPVSTNLRRTRYTEAQAGLGQTDRQENLKGSFEVKSPGQLAGKHVLLIDDVFTTGATLRAAARALKAAGVSRVSGLTLARVDLSLPQGSGIRGVSQKPKGGGCAPRDNEETPISSRGVLDSAAVLGEFFEP
ncbi:MAG TPA: ComF family protein [Bryobacteraceae bacterium]|nr:ComF family protein [Bryobacteraceae bacterium]